MLTHFWSVLLPFPPPPSLLLSPLPKVSRKCFCFLLFSIFHLPFSISYFNMSLNWACYLCKPSDTLWPQSRQFSEQSPPLPLPLMPPAQRVTMLKKQHSATKPSETERVSRQSRAEQRRDKAWGTTGGGRGGAEGYPLQVQTCGGVARGRGKNKESKVDITTRTVVIKMPCS